MLSIISAKTAKQAEEIYNKSKCGRVRCGEKYVISKVRKTDEALGTNFYKVYGHKREE